MKELRVIVKCSRVTPINHQFPHRTPKRRSFFLFSILTKETHADWWSFKRLKSRSNNKRKTRRKRFLWSFEGEKRKMFIYFYEEVEKLRLRGGEEARRKHFFASKKILWLMMWMKRAKARWVQQLDKRKMINNFLYFFSRFRSVRWLIRFGIKSEFGGKSR